MTPPTHLLVGGLLLLWAVAGVRLREKSWVSPGAILLLTYGVYCFLDPVLRYHGVHHRDFTPETWPTLSMLSYIPPWKPNFNPEAWPTLSVFNATCYAALVFGYLLPRLPLRRDKQAYLLERPRRMFDRAGFFAAALLGILVVGVLFVGLGTLGRFTLPKELFTDYKPPGYELLVSLYPILYVFVPALFVSAYFDVPRAARLRKVTLWLLVGLVTLFVMATLGRVMIFTILLTSGIIYHFRYRPLKGRYLVGALLFVGLVTFVALLRRAHVGISQIDLETIRQLFASGRIVFSDWFVFTVMIFDTQHVLSHLIGIIDEGTGPYYGQTYVNSVLMRIVPFDVPGLGFMSPPQIWYRAISGSEYGSSGRSFSILAEAYMNFGRSGWVVFLFVGMLVRYLSFKVYTTRHPVMLLWAAFGIVVLIVALRNDSLTLFMQMGWYIIPLIVFRWILLFVRQLSHPIESGEGRPA